MRSVDGNRPSIWARTAALAAILAGPWALAQANSSWIWISETRPYDVLPWVIAGTLAIELAILTFLGRIPLTLKGAAALAAANLASFAAPYAVNYWILTQEGFEFSHYLEYWPSYIVGLAYAAATILVEFPIVYGVLRKEAKDRKRLAASIALANFVSTGFVALVERLLCRGRW